MCSNICTGSRLAVQSNAPDGPPILRLFDVRRGLAHPSHTITLEKFDASAQTIPHSFDINDIVFSPDGDGLHLAVARSDNSCHVYDSRYLDRVLQYCRHDDSIGYDTSYGVVNAHWVQGTHQRALVTGGADGTLHPSQYERRKSTSSSSFSLGCVRLWRVDQVSDQPSDSKVLARCDYDIGHFVLGDVTKGEKAMIV